MNANAAASRLYFRLYLRSFSLPGLQKVPRGHFRLPFEPFGRGEIERIVEVPWAVSRCHAAARLLEVGFARAESYWLRLLNALPAEEVHGLDIMPPESYRHPHLLGRIKTRIGSILDAPYADDFFDCILCISTLEHIGVPSDEVRNPYGADPWQTPSEWFDAHTADLEAIREMWRITSPGGRLLLTIPYGRLAYYGSHIQYDRDRVERLLQASGYRVASSDYYRYSDGGYCQVAPESLADVLYQRDGAPAATGLACLELVKD